jgi:dynein heavy chain
VINNNQHNSDVSENSGPMDEILFWKRRRDDFCGITNQLKGDNVQKIIDILKIVNSSYLEQFLKLSVSIMDGFKQSEDNLKFLSVLVEPCKELTVSELKYIPKTIPKLLNCIRVIWSQSKYYNTKEKITGLLRKLSNEIIRKCSDSISLKEIFHGDALGSLVMLRESNFLYLKKVYIAGKNGKKFITRQSN